MTLTISRILHAGYVFACEGTRIAFDPIFENPFSRNCHAFPEVRFDHAAIIQDRFDAVFISHFHDDHCSFDSLNLLDRSTPIYLYCLFDELFAMLGALGFTEVHQLRTNTPVTLGAITVIPREALDADVDSLFQIQAGGLNVLNVVDAWIDPRALAILATFAPWDMVLWPFQTMRELAVLSPARAEPAPATLPAEWLEQLAQLAPRYVVPSSCQFVQEPWSWYNQAFFPVTYRQFQQEVEGALGATRVIRLNPGVTVLLNADGLQDGAALPWVLPQGEQDVDYQFDPARAPMATAAIARHFPALDALQDAHVRDFCTGALMEKYRALETPAGSYFEQPRIWQLTLFDHLGQSAIYTYRIEADTIEADTIEADTIEAIAPGGPITHCDADGHKLSWTTEVPVARLYGALALGETLTSMYLRINDQVFDAATEAALLEADIVDDPLIRCLFNDVFGAYQAAQLARLQATGAASR